MLRRFLQTLKTHSLISPGEHLIVGVSGGPDSMCLLGNLLELRPRWKLRLTVAHQQGYFEKGREGLDREYAQLVRGFCARHQVAFKMNREDFRGKNGREEAARKKRLFFFEKIRKQLHADKIVLAHNRDENIETMIFRFFRGTGLRGLAGIAYERDRIARPLLDCPKKQLIAYCRKKKIPYIHDYSNEIKSGSRYFIRRELLPLIKKHLARNTDAALRQSLELLRESAKVLEEVAQSTAAQLKCENGKYSLAHFIALPSALRREVLRFWARENHPGAEVSYAHLHELERMLLTAQDNRKKTLTSQLTIVKRRDTIELVRG